MEFTIKIERDGQLLHQHDVNEIQKDNILRVIAGEVISRRKYDYEKILELIPQQEADAVTISRLGRILGGHNLSKEIIYSLVAKGLIQKKITLINGTPRHIYWRSD